jgi:uncharacterized protein YkwD
MYAISYCLYIFLITFILVGCDKDPYEIDNIKEDMLDAVNAYRRSGCSCEGDTMPPVDEVEWSDQLQEAATYHVNDMVENNIFDHIGSDGRTPHKRAADAGFTGVLIGENIARGYLTVEDVMNSWMNSSGHCKNIMDPNFSYMAVAYKDYHWVQLFGSD